MRSIPFGINRRVGGVALLVLGGIVLAAPIIAGNWIIALLGLALIAAGLFQFVDTARNADEATTLLSYSAGTITLLLGLLLFLSPRTAVSGLLVALTAFLLFDGGVKIHGGIRMRGSERRWGIINGIVSLVLAGTVWYFTRTNLGIIAISLVLGLRMVAEGWTMLLHQVTEVGLADVEVDLRRHPDRRVSLDNSETVAEIQQRLMARGVSETGRNIAYCIGFLALFFAIHGLRVGLDLSILGLISPITAVFGDAIMALIIGVLIAFPFRLAIRKFLRPVERIAWRRLDAVREKGDTPTPAEVAIGLWVENRLKFAVEIRQMRHSLHFSFWRVLRMGLPLTAIFIAVNSIWGFSWYFNSENWASGVWQEITKSRVDKWREWSAVHVELDALAKGISPESVFEIKPEGVPANDDFNFIVIGDTGEGDPSQMSLRDQLIDASKRDEVKFLVLSSDVIYPDGKMKDYETNFYMGFKGFEKPIYAIPGNHDWFDADEGFNANFLDRDSALISLRARFMKDFKTELAVPVERNENMVNMAARLRELYRIRNGLQRAPFFEMHADRFSFIAGDTGIMRQFDEKEKAWFEAALKRAGDRFKMVVLGHPFYVNGKDTASDAPEFESIHEMLRKHNVDVMMAGDTHDFEFYKERYQSEGRDREMLHFVNGGGGAYLSIGTAASFPKDPFTPDYAYYPRTDELKTKIYNETPYWKMPFWFWMERLGGYPFDSEMVSGAFDFNRAPFFQSFVEVRVEGSRDRVRFFLNGVNGRLRWRDIQTGGNTMPAGALPDDPVEFTAPMKPAQK